MKKTLFLLTMLAIIGLCQTNVNAQNGKTGPLTWSISDNTLTISGSGDMPDYGLSNFSPWSSYQSSFSTVIIGDSVTTIGNGAFTNCSDITSISIPNSVTAIGNGAFYYCSGLTSISIPNSVTTIGEIAFMFCRGLISITIPNSVTTIGYKVFAHCSGLTSITIPNSMTTIGNETFSYCSGLTSITIPNTVTTIGDEAFSYCSGLTSIIIPNSVTTIGYKAFAHCSGLISITIPNSVTTIGSYAFWYCGGLTSIAIGSSVKTIGSQTFYYCNNLAQIIVKAANPPALGVGVFSNTPDTISIYVPCQSLEAYQTAHGWNEVNFYQFRNIVGSIISNVTVEANDPQMGSAGVVEEDCETGIAIIQATPTANHRFVKWQDGNTDNPRMVTITEDATYTAEFVSTIGISESIIFPFEVYAHNNTLVIKQAEGQPVTVFDMMGRIIFQTTATEESTFNLSTAGVYIVRVGEGFARKVVIN